MEFSLLALANEVIEYAGQVGFPGAARPITLTGWLDD
jgi:hypothetical protein